MNTLTRILIISLVCSPVTSVFAQESMHGNWNAVVETSFQCDGLGKHFKRSLGSLHMNGGSFEMRELGLAGDRIFHGTYLMYRGGQRALFEFDGSLERGVHASLAEWLPKICAARGLVMENVSTTLKRVKVTKCAVRRDPLEPEHFKTLVRGIVSGTLDGVPVEEGFKYCMRTSFHDPPLGYEQWMRDFYPWLRKKRLYELTLPGTHQSGAYNLDPTQVAPNFPWDTMDRMCGWLPDWMTLRSFIIKCADKALVAQAQDFGTSQTLRIGEQLREGIRFFDLRVGANNKNLYVYNGLVGDSAFRVLSEFEEYIANVERELVIIAPSQMGSMSHQNHVQFLNMIADKLGPYLLTYDENLDLKRARLRQLVDHGPRIIVFYDDDYIAQNPTPWVWPKSMAPGAQSDFMYGSTSQTVDPDAMEQDQAKKLTGFAGGPEGLFQLRWVLTESADSDFAAMELFKRSLEMAALPNWTLEWLFHVIGFRVDDYTTHSTFILSGVNRRLGDFLYRMEGFKVNVILVDFFERSNAVPYAISLSLSEDTAGL